MSSPEAEQKKDGEINTAECSPDKCSNCPHASSCNSEIKRQSTEAGCAPEKCKGCPNAGKCGKSTGPSPEQIEIGKRFSTIKKIIIVLSGKGGVGKSTVSTQFSFWLSECLGKRVGLVDVDICGPSIPTLTNSKDKEVHQCAQGWEPVYVTENLNVMSVGFMLNNEDDAVVMRGPRKHSMIVNFLKEVCWGELDFLIIDTPPGTSDEHLSTINLLLGALSDRKQDVSSIIVTTPQEVALADVRKEIHFCQQMKLHIAGIVENMSGFVCPHCNKESEIFNPSTGGAKKMCQSMNVPYLGNIPMDPVLMMASEKGIPWAMSVEIENPNATDAQLSPESSSVGLGKFAKIVEKALENIDIRKSEDEVKKN